MAGVESSTASWQSMVTASSQTPVPKAPPAPAPSSVALGTAPAGAGAAAPAAGAAAPAPQVIDVQVSGQVKGPTGIPSGRGPIGYILSWILWAYLWAWFTAVMIYFVDSQFNFKETIEAAILLLIYPVLSIFGFIFSLLYRFIFCPINHLYVSVMNTLFGGTKLSTIIINPLGTVLNPLWWTSSSSSSAKKYQQNAYCGSNRAETCAKNPNTGRILNLSTWLCPHQKGGGNQRGCTFGCSVPPAPSSWTNPMQYIQIYGP